MDYKQILSIASQKLEDLKQTHLQILDLKQPKSIESAIQLSKVVSKLSPLMGNMIEFSTIDHLNSYPLGVQGKWIRQDPGFPDALFASSELTPNIGIEIKAWFPLATEITARFKDSVNMFAMDNINVALIAWLPEFVFWGEPKIIDVLIVSGKSVAIARDKHYHKPPQYIVLEPEDTTARTGNLQQTNTNGYKLQDDKCSLEEALKYTRSLGADFLTYKADAQYQAQVRQLQAKFIYRLDTNFAKIDRIEHKDIETFKKKVENTLYQGKTIKDWQTLVNKEENYSELKSELNRLLSNKI